MTLSRGVRLPLYFVVLLLLALGINLVRGFGLARRRTQQLQPRRVEQVLDLRDGSVARSGPTEETNVSINGNRRFLLVHLPARPAGKRLALQQIVGERRLHRWTEENEGAGEWLVVPLSGLTPGEYGFRWSAPGYSGASEDIRRVGTAEDIRWLGRFTLRRP